MGVVRKLSDYRQQERHVETPEAAGKGFALIHRQFMDSKLYKDCLLYTSPSPRD